MNDIVGIVLWGVLIGTFLAVFIGQKLKKKNYKGEVMEVTKNWYETSQSMYGEDTTKKAWFFTHDDSFLTTGHRLENRNHQVVYEAKVLYGDAFSGYEVDFINHLINYKHHHLLSAEVSTDYTFDGMGMTVDSYFKFDGIDIWDYIASLGYTYHFELFGLAYKVSVFKEGNQVGCIYSSNNGKNYFDCTGEIEPKAGDHWYYVLECANPDLDALFLLAMGFARCELSMRNLK